MARSAVIPKNTYSAALASGVTKGMICNVGPGSAFVVLDTVAPTGTVDGAKGYPVPAGAVLPMPGIDAAVNVYVGAAGDATSVEFTLEV